MIGLALVDVGTGRHERRLAAGCVAQRTRRGGLAAVVNKPARADDGTIPKRVRAGRRGAARGVVGARGGGALCGSIRIVDEAGGTGLADELDRQTCSARGVGCSTRVQGAASEAGVRGRHVGLGDVVVMVDCVCAGLGIPGVVGCAAGRRFAAVYVGEWRGGGRVGVVHVAGDASALAVRAVVAIRVAAGRWRAAGSIVVVGDSGVLQAVVDASAALIP